MSVSCSNCGASQSGNVCEYCGTLLTSLESLDAERKALARLHECISEADTDRQKRLLRNGFLPTYPEVLVDAGLRCVPLVNEAEIANEPRESAILRLRMIVAKLTLLQHTPEIDRAIAQFEESLDRFAASEKTYTIVGAVLIAGLVVIVVGAAWYWFGA